MVFMELAKRAFVTEQKSEIKFFFNNVNDGNSLPHFSQKLLVSFCLPCRPASQKLLRTDIDLAEA
jgi:hypothetical protein